jgi:putative ABC transport system permease protein
LRLDDLLRLSVRQVLRHRHRYLGVFLAIALGTAGFITIITMGRDLKEKFNQDLDLIGGVTIILISFDNQLTSRPLWFRPNTMAALRRLPGVKDVSRIAMNWAEANWRNHQYNFAVIAVDEAFWGVRNFWPHTGKLFGPKAVSGRKRECVLGAALAKNIFGHQNVAGYSIEIDHELYRVMGVLGGLVDSSLTNSAFLPLTTAMDRLPGVTLPDRLYIRCLTWDDVEKVAAAIPDVIQAHQFSEQLQIRITWERLERVIRIAWWIEFFIYSAIGATMLLGGMGIWNVMMAAVRSRTREIGLKKAVGAEDRDILAHFLTEAVCLSLSAALVGIGLGRLMIETMGYILNNRPPEGLFLLSSGLGLMFALLIGVGAGLYPSLQASRMEVVTATRYE